MPIELKDYDPAPFFDEMMACRNRARPAAKELIGLFRQKPLDILSRFIAVIADDGLRGFG